MQRGLQRLGAVARPDDAVGHWVPRRLPRKPQYHGRSCSFRFSRVRRLWALGDGSGLSAILLILRTALEDRTLLAELTGYMDYARQVPRRLLPGIW